MKVSTAFIIGLAVISSASCDDAAAEPRYFSRDAWRPPLRCTGIAALQSFGPVNDLVNVSDSAFAALLPDSRELLVFDDDWRMQRRMTFDKDGPRGVLRPTSVAITDSMIFVADDARSQIRQFDREGADAGTIRLPFVPRRIRMSGGQLIVTPLVAGGSPQHMAFRIDGSNAVPLGGEIARYDDIGVNTLANMSSIAAFPDRVVVMHEMVVPFGYVMTPTAPRSLPQRFGVPIPAEMAGRVDRLPKAPLAEGNVNELSVIAFAAAPDPRTGSTYYVTRTGDGARAHYQKLLVHLDTALAVRGVFPIDANPHHMAYLPSRRTLIVIDSDSEWFECRLPKDS